MKTRSPFLTLVKFELSLVFTSFGGVLECFMAVSLVGVHLMPGLVLLFQPERGDFLLVLNGWAALIVFLWVAMLCGGCATTLLREYWDALTPSAWRCSEWNEYVFTRALDRRICFRAKSVMLVVVVVVPALLNLGSLCLVSGTLVPGVAGFARLDVGQRFESFSVSAPAADSSAAFGYAMLWASMAIFVVAQGYYALVSRLVAGRGAVVIGIAAALPVVVSGVALLLMFDPFEHPVPVRAAHFFIGHWVPMTLALPPVALLVQWFCERRFAELEVL